MCANYEKQIFFGEVLTILVKAVFAEITQKC